MTETMLQPVQVLIDVIRIIYFLYIILTISYLIYGNKIRLVVPLLSEKTPFTAPINQGIEYLYSVRSCAVFASHNWR